MGGNVTLNTKRFSDMNETLYKYLEDSRVCDPGRQLLLTQSYYMLVAAVLTVSFLSFFVHRKRLRPNCCQGRPGVLQPVNLLDDIHRRWMYVACFIILAQALVQQTTILYYWNSGKDSEWKLKFDWLSVLLQMIMMIHFCIVYYPLFACVAYRKSIIANVVGFLYAIPLFVVECVLLSKCPANGILRGLLTMWRIPTVIALVVYLFGSIFELVRNVRNTRPVTITTSFGEVCREHEHYMIYVRHLLRRKQQLTDTENQSTSATTISRWLQRAIRFLRSLKYENVPGFRYSTAVLSAATVTIITISVAVISMSWFADWLYIIIYLLVSPFDFLGIVAVFLDYFYITRVVFHVANVFAGMLQLALNGHMFVRYRRNVLLMYRGNHDWHHKLTLSPTSLMVGAMNYPSYHIVYFSLGWIVSSLVLFIVVLLVAVLILVPIRDHQITFIIQQIIFIWPTVVISLVIYIAHTQLCKNVFLQNPNILAIENRRLYFVISYFTFMINIFVGIFSALRRFLIAIFLGAFLIGRLDFVITMRGFEQYDGAHETYLSMLTVEVAQNHPVMRAFIELLRRSTTSVECTDGTNRSHKADVVLRHRHSVKRSKRIRMRWFKLVTLINNPSLVDDRLNQLRRDSINKRRKRKDHGKDVSNVEPSSSISTIVSVNSYYQLDDRRIYENEQRY